MAVMTVKDFFDQVHRLITINYINKNISEEISNANLLDTFFKEVKRFINRKKTRGNNDISKNLYTTIETAAFEKELKEVLKNNNMGQQIRTILYKQGGTIGESNVAAVIQAFMNTMVQNSSKQLNSIMTGTEQGNVQGLNQAVKDKINSLFGIMKTNMYAVSSQNTKRSIKTDIDVSRGNYPELSVKISTENILPNAIQVYNILRTAKFSIKNYSEASYYSTANLSLGNTHITKVFGALAHYFGINIYDGIENVKREPKNYQKENDIIGGHIFHIRFLYELTGIGLEGRPVDYLLFNTPDGNKISVRSVKQIVSNIFKDASMGGVKGVVRDQQTTNPFLNYSVKLSKEYFENF